MKNLGTIREFAKAQGFKTISIVDSNVNEYKFVTFCKKDADGNLADAENIYLSKALAEEVELGAALDTDLPVYETENAAGETRIKIGSVGASKHMEL